MFSGTQKIFINNSRLIENSATGPTGIDILLEASTPEATHDSSAHAYVPRYFSGTREQYIGDIIHWALPAVYESPLPLHWMRGAARVGKSAIAQTSVEEIRSTQHIILFLDQQKKQS